MQTQPLQICVAVIQSCECTMRIKKGDEIHAAQTPKWTEIVWCVHKTHQAKHRRAYMLACTHKQMHAHTRTRSFSSLLALQAVSHPSIHVTERWVHPVTGQLVAVTLIYVAPLSSTFLLWWKNCVFLLPIRNFSSAYYNGKLMWELSQIKAAKRVPVVNKLDDGVLAMQHHLLSLSLCSFLVKQ